MFAAKLCFLACRNVRIFQAFLHRLRHRQNYFLLKVENALLLFALAVGQ